MYFRHVELDLVEDSSVMYAHRYVLLSLIRVKFTVLMLPLLPHSHIPPLKIENCYYMYFSFFITIIITISKEHVPRGVFPGPADSLADSPAHQKPNSPLHAPRSAAYILLRGGQSYFKKYRR